MADEREPPRDSFIELRFTKAEMKLICAAATAAGKMVRTWVRDTLIAAASSESGDDCEHGIAEGSYCPECNLAYKQARKDNGDID